MGKQGICPLWKSSGRPSGSLQPVLSRHMLPTSTGPTLFPALKTSGLPWASLACTVRLTVCPLPHCHLSAHPYQHRLSSWCSASDAAEVARPYQSLQA